MNDKTKEIRLRLRDDFAFYAEKCVKIRTKEGDFQQFKLNPVQNRLQETVNAQYKAMGKTRIIILKARQQGLSTWAAAYVYFKASQEPAKMAVVVANETDTTETLFGMYHRIHQEMPDLMRPSTKYSSKKEIVFDGLDTRIKVLTAGGNDIGRGYTPNYAHLSEVAFWPANTAAKNFSALTEGIPDLPGTGIIVESTANGMSGKFYELWRDAVEGKNEFIAFFAPWFETPEYRIPVGDDFERTYEEEEIAQRYGLDNEQLQFRRHKIGRNGRESFEQEYPSCIDEAFKSSGRPVFEPETIHSYLRRKPEILRKMEVEDGSVNDLSIGRLTVYREKDAGEVYTIGADIAGGQRNGDYSVAQVLDSERRQVAIWRGQVDPAFFATILNTLGLYYNTALIAAESNNHGLLTNVKLRDLGYPNIFTDISEGKTEDGLSINLGFRTTSKTKPLIIDRLRAELRTGSIEINDDITLKEMLTYIMTETGTMEAATRCHDDCIVALAIANHVLVHRWDPIVFGDEFYVDAI